MFCSPEREQIANRVAVVDAMVVVQKVIAHEKKTEKIQTFLDFANAFLGRIDTMAKGFHEVRVVFDFYEQLSLKNATRKKRGSSVILTGLFCMITRALAILYPDF